MAQWWERSPPTNVSWVQFPDPASCVGWVCCWFSTLPQEVFLWVLRFSPLLKTNISKFQFDLDVRHFSNEPLARVFAQALPVFDVKFTFTFTFTFTTLVTIYISNTTTYTTYNTMQLLKPLSYLFLLPTFLISQT